MKTSRTEKSAIKINKKLNLKKEMVSQLNLEEMNNFAGGAAPKTFKVCELLTITFYCSHTYTSVCV